MWVTMIAGIGIDSIEINRFSNWHTYPYSQLKKIFTPQEINYCLACPNLSTQRFAARFATKEAAFKAWSQATGSAPLPLFSWFSSVEVCIDKKYPILKIMRAESVDYRLWVSITHTKSTATSMVVIEFIGK